VSPPRRRRELTPQELALWRRAVGEAPPEPERPASVPPPSPAGAIRDATVPKAAPARRGAALDPTRPVGLDRRSWLRLKRGQVVIELILDLHGQTQEAAHRNLIAFLQRAQAEGRRCVLVVTGKGQPGGGILRHMVPRWLNEGGNRERVVAYTPAQRRHGGAGALYVLLRRHRAGPQHGVVSANG
jgi:DNA-nicking Smr family endonuclease